MRIAVCDVRGREIWAQVEGPAEAGEHRLLWNERDRAGVGVSRGVYLVRLEAGGITAARKVVLMQR